MAESRFGLCIPIAMAETRPLGGRGGRGRDEAGTQLRGGTEGLSLRWSCRRFGTSLEETATPQPTAARDGSAGLAGSVCGLPFGRRSP
jgi:hypothetical protein